MMTSAQVVETSVNVTSNSPSQDYTHPDDHNLPNYEVHYKQTFFSASRPLPAEMTYTAKMTVAIVENMLSRKCDPKTKQNKIKKQNKTFG